MTVVAWDGHTLAADRRATTASYHYPVTKVFRLDADRMAAVSGHIGLGLAVVEWVKRGGPVEEYPKLGDDDWCTCMVVHRDGRILAYESRPHPIAVEHGFHALGSGRDYALAALHLGHTATEAVAVASALCADCGDGVNAMTFEDP